MKTFALLVAAMFLSAILRFATSDARAQGYVTNSGPVQLLNSATAPVITPRVALVLLGGTSPASPSTVIGPSVIGIDNYVACTILARIRGATGGPLDIYLQSTLDGGTTWYDVGHYTQLAAAAALVATVGTFAKGFAQTPTTVNTLDGTPSIAAGFQTNTLGGGLRVVYVAGAATSAGAVQVISLYCYNPIF